MAYCLVFILILVNNTKLLKAIVFFSLFNKNSFIDSSDLLGFIYAIIPIINQTHKQFTYCLF